MIRLDSALGRHLEHLAVSVYPREACGVLLGRHDSESVDVERLLGARNLASRAGRFGLDPGELVAADSAARAEGLEVAGFWHSHADTSARPSRADVAGAWMGWTQVIASVVASRVADVRAFRIRDDGIDEVVVDEGVCS